MKSIQLDEWEQALSDAMGKRGDSIPKDFITMRQFANKIGKHLRTATEDMHRILGAGLAEKRMFRIPLGDNIRPVPHYRLKAK